MSAEEVGIYIRLLCCQWSNGPLSDRHIRACGGNSDAGRFVLEEKFVKTDGGYVNQRLETVRQLRDIRKKCASKGGSKTQANRQAKVEANPEQTTKQTGVAKLKSPTPTPTPTPSSVPNPIPNPIPERESEASKPENPLSLSKHGMNPSFQKAWTSWKQKQAVKSGKMDVWTEQSQLKELERFETDEAIAVVEYSTSRTNCVNLITNGDHRRARASPLEDPSAGTAKGKAIVERMFGGAR
jgi:uncharacterized protein YdaU (DUF1376 family)